MQSALTPGRRDRPLTNPERAFLGLVFVFFVFKYGWMASYTFGPPLKPTLALVGAGMVAFAGLVAVAPVPKRVRAPLDLGFVLLVLGVGIGAVVGVAKTGNPKAVLAGPQLALPLWFAYWISSRTFGPRFYRWMIWVMLAAVPVVALEGVYAYAAKGAIRFMSRHAYPVLAIYGVALFMAMTRWGGLAGWQRLLVGLGLLSTGLFLILSQQRAALVTWALLTPGVAGLALLGGHTPKRALATLLLGGFGILALGFLLLYFSPLWWTLVYFFGRLLEAAGSGLTGGTMAMRLSDNAAAWASYLSSPLLGQGLGAEIYSTWARSMAPALDNSYMLYLWKTGVLGLLGVLILLGGAAWHGIKGVLAAGDPERASLWMLVAMLGAVPLFMGTVSGCFYFHRFVLFWALGAGGVAALGEEHG